MKNTILGGLRSAGITVEQFAKLCGESRSTLYRHLADPDTLTYKEIRMLRRYTDVRM